MKISDFKMETRNVAPSGEPEKLDTFQAGSRGNLWGIGSKDGKRFQIKIHAAEPKWYLVDQKIKELNVAIKNATDPDEQTRLTSELETLKKNRDKQNKKDQDSDNYVKSKKDLIARINSARSDQLVCPVDFWTEPIEKKQNATFAVEAVPWIEQNVGFDGTKPIDFRRDLNLDEQYDVVASLCKQLSVLHSKGVLHSDLKLGNTVVTRDSHGFKCSIIDFDSAILLDDLYSDKYGVNVWYYIVGGTFFSPELYPLYIICREENDPDEFSALDKRSITTKSDIFALGITIYEYFYGEADGKNVLPFVSPDGEALDSPQYAEAVKYGYKTNLPDSVPDLLFGAINWSLDLNPDERPTAEQLAQVFATKNISLIPAKYTRNPLWEEHQGKYKLIEKPDVTIKKGSKPRYRLLRKGVGVTRNIDELVKEGYAVMLSADGTAITEIETSKNDLWECDGSGKLPSCVERALSPGKYVLKTMGITRGGYTYGRLKSEGYLCTESEMRTPWPQDSKMTFSTSRTVRRDLLRGAGHYLVGDGISAVRYTKQELLDKGLASIGIIFSLCDSDAVDYIPAPENLPSTVKAITRSAIVNHQYRLEHTDGRIEKLMIGDMLAKGYVRRK